MSDLLESFGNFYNIIIKLRSKDGCPWDREQTATSVRTNLLEEVYECIEAISDNDDFHTAEELGDILLVVSLISRIKEEENAFTFKQVIDKVTDKLVRRHPHVFSDTVIKTSDDVKRNWELIKKTEDSEAGAGANNKELEKSILDGISKSIPPLERAYRFQKKAAKAGFDWDRIKDVLGKVKEEIQELEHEINLENKDKIEEEFGDILFSVINAARFLKVDPSVALHRTNEKFFKRFNKVEKRMEEKGLPMKHENLEIMDKLWEEAKKSDRIRSESK